MYWLAVYIQLSGAHLARADLATENREFTWGDSPDLNIPVGSKACGLEWLKICLFADTDAAKFTRLSNEACAHD